MCAFPPGREVLWGVQLSGASFFVGSPLRGEHVFPQSRARPLGGGATANAVVSPTLKSSASEFVVPVVVPGA